MMTNPYASFLGTQDPLAVIGNTAKQLEALLAELGPQRSVEAPAPGKWSAREIVCHLADCELVFAYRLRQTLAQPHHVIQPFDQDQWARQYGAHDARSALAVFDSVRRWNVDLIRALPPEVLAKPVMHPERGEMTFQVIVETMAGHDINHLGQMKKLAAS
jgi:uncharacterized damage-inducible protein DinB